MKLELTDFERILLRGIAENMREEMPERVRTLRLSAIYETQQRLREYSRRGYMAKLLCTIAEKKCAKIKSISTQAEMEKLIKPRCPRYNGNEFEADDFIIPEEELICWSEASLRAPLNEAGFKRYMELFKRLLPKESKSLNA